MIQRRDLLLGMPGMLLGCHAAAQTAPLTAARNGRLLVGFLPGGSIDLVARLLVEQLKAPAAATSMIVDNRPGAGGRLALEALRVAQPDGSTIGLTPGDQLTLFPVIYKRLGYDPLRDFAPVTTVCTFPFVLAVGPLVPMKVTTLADFMAWCRANPGQANFGSPGEGTRPHFMGTALARTAGVELTHLPYKGGAAALQDLLAGQVAALVSVLSNVLPHAQAGRLRVLVVSAPRRAALLPATPTAREAGYLAFEGEEWFGVFAPPSTPADMVEAWNGAIRRALATESVKAALLKQAFQPADSTPQELMALVRSDLELWRRVVKESGFTPID